jgi:hypothetical protein
MLYNINLICVFLTGLCFLRKVLISNIIDTHERDIIQTIGIKSGPKLNLFLWEFYQSISNSY